MHRLEFQYKQNVDESQNMRVSNGIPVGGYGVAMCLEWNGAWAILKVCKYLNIHDWIPNSAWGCMAI